MFDSFVPSSGNTWDKSFNSSFTSECGNAEPADAITPGLAINNIPAGGASGEVIDIPPAPASDFSLILLDTPLQAQADITTNRHETQAVDALTRQALPAAVVGGAISSAHSALAEFASDPDFADKMNLAFGEGWDATVAGDLAQDWLTGDFSELPPVEIRAGAEINGANGAFAGATNTIYLSSEFVAGNAGSPEAIASVLLEEIGHYIDSRINTSDAAGDEGAIFAGAVQGKEFDAAELQALKAEDDTATVMLDGQAILIEQAANKKADFNGDGKTDFFRQEKAIWDNDNTNTANVYLSNGNGTFGKQDLTPTYWDLKGDDGVNIIFGDFNGDRKTDFIGQEKASWDDDTTNTANIFFSNGNGTFRKQDITDHVEMKGDFTNLIIGDYNGDGKDDFIRQEKGLWDDDTIKTAQVYFSNGDGTFWKRDLPDIDEMKGDFTNLIAGDYNGDGKDDFIRQEKGLWDDDSIKTAQVYLSNGNGTFGKQDLPDTDKMKGDQTNLIIGDFNGDRRADFIRQEKGLWDDDSINTAQVYLSNANGTFAKQDLPDIDEMKGDFTNLIVGDYNGDGKEDFIRQEKGLWDDDSIKTAQVYFSNGNGTFRKQDLTDNLEMKGDQTNLILGDFNGDRRTDFIRQEKGDWDNDSINTANLYLSNANGTFSKSNLTNDPNSMKGDDGVNIMTGGPELYSAPAQIPATNPDIDIRLDFFGNFTQTQKDLIEKAAQNWERIITKDMVPTGILNIAVTQGSTTISGKQWNGPWAETNFPYPEKTLATPNTRQNLPTSYDNQRGIDYHTQMHFNSNKLPALSNNSLVALATHEIGHALYLDEAQDDTLLGLDGVMDKIGLDQRITQGIYQRLEYLGYSVDRNAPVYWS